jgi:hypothetical protein
LSEALAFSSIPSGTIRIGTIRTTTFKLGGFEVRVEGELSRPDLQVGGMRYVFHSELRFYEDGSVKAGGLSTELMEPFTFMIGGSPLKTGLASVVFHPDGGIMWAETTRGNAFTFKKEKTPDSSLVFVYRSNEGNESAFFLPKDPSTGGEQGGQPFLHGFPRELNDSPLE